jgi:hypothetical protein
MSCSSPTLLALPLLSAVIFLIYLIYIGMQWPSWLRHCTTSRNMGSIPDGVIGIFHRHNRSGHTMALGSTQPLTEMSTRNIFWGAKAAGE